MPSRRISRRRVKMWSLWMLCVDTMAATENVTAPPPMHHLLAEPPPPPPSLVAGLRSLLRSLDGCDASCLERGEDWFEQARKWGASSVQSMVRLGLIDSFVGALALPARAEEEVRRRLSLVSTVVTLEQHDEL